HTSAPTHLYTLSLHDALPICFFRLLHHLSEQSAHHIVLDQPIAIFRVGTVIPRGFIHAQSDEPPVQHVVAQLLAQQPLAANPIRSEEHTSELQSLAYLVCRLL